LWSPHNTILRLVVYKQSSFVVFTLWGHPISLRSFGIIYTYSLTCHVRVTYTSRLPIRLISIHDSFPVRFTTPDSAAIPVKTTAPITHSFSLPLPHFSILAPHSVCFHPFPQSLTFLTVMQFVYFSSKNACFFLHVCNC